MVLGSSRVAFMLHKISKLDIYLSLCHCKSCADDIPQTDRLSSICYSFKHLLKKFDTIWFRIESLVCPFSVLFFRLTAFLFAYGKTKN